MNKVNQTETHSQIQRTDRQLSERREVEGLSERGKGIKKKNHKTQTTVW